MVDRLFRGACHAILLSTDTLQSVVWQGSSSSHLKKQFVRHGNSGVYAMAQ